VLATLIRLLVISIGRGGDARRLHRRVEKWPATAFRRSLAPGFVSTGRFKSITAMRKRRASTRRWQMPSAWRRRRESGGHDEESVDDDRLRLICHLLPSRAGRQTRRLPHAGESAASRPIEIAPRLLYISLDRRPAHRSRQGEDPRRRDSVSGAALATLAERLDSVLHVGLSGVNELLRFVGDR